jgi:addiction module HigA family antidote
MLLEEFIKPLGLQHKDVADRLGISKVRLSEIIHAKRAVTPDTALRLERLTGMSAQFWLSGQLAWDLYHAMHSARAKEISKVRRLPQLAAAS